MISWRRKTWQLMELAWRFLASTTQKYNLKCCQPQLLLRDFEWLKGRFEGTSLCVTGTEDLIKFKKSKRPSFISLNTLLKRLQRKRDWANSLVGDPTKTPTTKSRKKLSIRSDTPKKYQAPAGIENSVTFRGGASLKAQYILLAKKHFQGDVT